MRGEKQVKKKGGGRGYRDEVEEVEVNSYM